MSFALNTPVSSAVVVCACVFWNNIKKRDLRHRISAELRKSELVVENRVNHFNKL